jgi:hypothetical protein
MYDELKWESTIFTFPVSNLGALVFGEVQLGKVDRLSFNRFTPVKKKIFF